MATKKKIDDTTNIAEVRVNPVYKQPIKEVVEKEIIDKEEQYLNGYLAGHDKSAEIDLLKQQLAESNAKIEQLMQMMIMANGANTATHSTPNSLNEEVKVVHLRQRDKGLTTHIELSNLVLDFNAFGEERTLDRRQAEELAGKYRRWFEDGTIAFGAGCEELAKRFTLKTVNDYSYMGGGQFVANLAYMSCNELEELYSKLCDGHKRFIIEYFKRKIIENDRRFNDPQKIEMLNRVSNGAMSGVLLDRSRPSQGQH